MICFVFGWKFYFSIAHDNLEPVNGNPSTTDHLERVKWNRWNKWYTMIEILLFSFSYATKKIYVWQQKDKQQQQQRQQQPHHVAIFSSPVRTVFGIACQKLCRWIEQNAASNAFGCDAFYVLFDTNTVGFSLFPLHLMAWHFYLACDCPSSIKLQSSFVSTYQFWLSKFHFCLIVARPLLYNEM